MADLLSGQVPMMFEGPTSTLPHVRSGKLRVLASSIAKRTQALPDVPTIAEAALPGFDISTWNGLAAPAGVPRPVLERLNALVVEFSRQPAAIGRFVATNIDLVSSTSQEIDERIRRELPLFTKVMRDAGIQPE